MNKEPLGLYIFRFVMGAGLFAFMCMLYWSSLLLEQNMRVMISDIAELKNDLSSLHSDMNAIRDDMQTAPPAGTAPSTKPATSFRGKNRPHIDPELPNLLQEDPFYADTLPKMLGKDFKPHGTFHSAVVGKPDNLHPFSNWSQVSAWQDQCTVSVARQQFGKYETMAPDMALKLEERKNKDTGTIEFWVHLRDNVFWQPLRQDFFSENINLAPEFFKKHPVNAHDFKFYFDALMNPHVQEAGAVSLRTYLGDIQEIDVLDDYTFIVRWKAENVTEADGKVVPKIKYVAKQLTGSLRPLARFVYQYFPDGKKILEDDTAPDTYRTNIVWAQNFSQHWAKNIIISCGPWVFEGMTERQITFKRNPNYYARYEALADAMQVAFKDSPDAVWQDFKANKIDTYDLQPDQLIEIETFLHSPGYKEQEAKGDAIKRLDYVMRSYNYIGWNEAKPFFSSKKVRQALTMAIDRRRIIQQNLNGMGIEITGTFYRYSPSYDPSIAPWPFDLVKARRQLAEEGWYDSDGDGIIDKQIGNKRVPFRFSLTYYVKNPTTKAICEYIATALKEVQIACDLNGVDVADLSAAFEDKSFDAICLGWALGSPPEDPKQLWYSKGSKEKGSSNAIGFSNAEADKIIEQLEYESNREKRLALFHRFDAIIHEEAPYTFLYTPKIALVYRDYLQNVFIPANRQDLIPGANVAEPDSSIFWLKRP